MELFFEVQNGLLMTLNWFMQSGLLYPTLGTVDNYVESFIRFYTNTDVNVPGINALDSSTATTLLLTGISTTWDVDLLGAGTIIS